MNDSETKYRMIVENTGIPHTVISLDGIFLFLNTVGARNLGGCPDDFVGKSVYVVLPDIAEITMERIRQIVKSGMSSTYEDFVELHAGGCWFESVLQPMRDVHGKLSSIQIISMDITKRKMMEEVLKIKDSAIESAMNGIALADLKGIITYVNPSFLKQWGYDNKEEVLGKPATLFWKSEAKAQEVVSELFSKGKRDGELLAKRKDGSFFHVRLSANMVTDDAGKPICMMSSFVNITKRKRAEEALRESEERHRVLFEGSQDAIMSIAPPSWNFTSGNPTSIRMFGARDEQDFCSRPPWKYSPEFQPDGRPSADKAKEMIQTAMRDGSNFFEWMHRRTDGKEFPATVLLSRIEISGQVLLQGTVRDITKRKKAEEQLQHKSRELEVLTEDLRKLSSLLSKENELSRRKLAGILHEQIGQNLAVFSMKFDDITEGIITGETKIKETISNLIPLLENTISSTRELTSDLYPTILDDLGFIPAVTWYKDLVLEPLKIAVLMDVDKSVENLPSDYKLPLFRITQEAFQNISKHARATKVEVKFSTHRRSMKLYIKDNGVGFDLKEMKSKKDKGIGLMLLEERSISLGGSLTIESALGKGTELTIELPINKQ